MSRHCTAYSHQWCDQWLIHFHRCIAIKINCLCELFSLIFWKSCQIYWSWELPNFSCLKPIHKGAETSCWQAVLMHKLACIDLIIKKHIYIVVGGIIALQAWSKYNGCLVGQNCLSIKKFKNKPPTSLISPLLTSLLSVKFTSTRKVFLCWLSKGGHSWHRLNFFLVSTSSFLIWSDRPGRETWDTQNA